MKQKGKLKIVSSVAIFSIVLLVVVALFAWGPLGDAQPSAAAAGYLPGAGQLCGAGTAFDPVSGLCVSAVNGVAPAITTTQGWYTYTDEVQVNLQSEDATGTGIAAVVYEYPFNSLPRLYWGNERRFTDEAIYYTRSITLTAGSGSQLYAPNEKLYFHYALALYEDAWVPETRIEMPYVVPTKGDMNPGDAASVGFSPPILDKRMYQFDSTDWTSAALDLGVAAANSTDTVLIVTETRLVTDDQITKVSHVVMQDFNKTEVKTLKYKLQGTDKNGNAVDTGWILVYDSAANIDNTQYTGSTTGWEYDSDDYSVNGESHESIISRLETTGGSIITLQVYVKADINTTLGAASLTNGEVLVNNIRIDDPEGSALVDQDIQG